MLLCSFLNPESEVIIHRERNKKTGISRKLYCLLPGRQMAWYCPVRAYMDGCLFMILYLISAQVQYRITQTLVTVLYYQA